VKNIVGTFEDSGIDGNVSNVTNFHLELGSSAVVRKIIQPTAAKIIEDPDLQSFPKEQVHHMATDEAGPAGDDGNR
jgi:hypothetical protein